MTTLYEELLKRAMAQQPPPSVPVPGVPSAQNQMTLQQLAKMLQLQG